MFAPQLTRRLFWAAEILVLVGTLATCALIFRADEWSPPVLVALLLGLSFLGEWFTLEVNDGILSASLVAIVLAMGLLGPTPAAACGIIAALLTSAMRRLAPAQFLNNLSAFAVVPLAGGLMVRALAGDPRHALGHQFSDSVLFGLILFIVFSAALALNFVLIGLDTRIKEGRSLREQMREFAPLLPGELAAGALATILAVAYRSAGLPILLASIALLLIFRQLTAALVRSEQRAEQLLARSRQLVRLQLGVLTTLVRALGMRDKTTERHAAAVAAYATALAIELGCSEEEQDVVRAAGLLHEIGKFTWPDRVLHAEVVSDEDLAIVARHPQEGAILVGALDGYGPVADAILYHHERVDGRGYPAGLIGSEIPLASRILAICSTYDTITASDTYRPQMTPEEAMSELRNAARNGQLDAELVERFIVLLERDGSTFAQAADFETELELERRVKDMAEPQTGEAAPRALRARSRARRGARRPDGPSLRPRILSKT